MHNINCLKTHSHQPAETLWESIFCVCYFRSIFAVEIRLYCQGYCRHAFLFWFCIETVSCLLQQQQQQQNENDWKKRLIEYQFGAVYLKTAYCAKINRRLLIIIMHSLKLRSDNWHELHMFCIWFRFQCNVFFNTFFWKQSKLDWSVFSAVIMHHRCRLNVSIYLLLLDN